MKRSLLLCTVLCMQSHLWSQANVHQQLHQIVQLELQGQFHEVIDNLPKLINSNSLDQGDLGQAWTVLGAAYQLSGDLMHAESAYERAIQICSQDQKYAGNYATALDNLADLYRDKEQLQIATATAKKALAIHEKLNDHAVTARSSLNLAALEIKDGHRKEAQAYLSQTLQEAKLDSKLDGDEDFHATVFSTQARLAELNGNMTAAIAGYQQAVEHWQHKYGEEHMLTGWGNLLLGNAYALSGRESIGLETMRKGLDILGRTLGQNNPKYLAGTITYSQVLDHAGDHAEAARLKNAAEQELARLSRSQCLNCRISAVAAFR